MPPAAALGPTIASLFWVEHESSEVPKYFGGWIWTKSMQVDGYTQSRGGLGSMSLSLQVHPPHNLQLE